MLGSGYEAAEMVELYDAGEVIRVNDDGDAYMGWSHIPSEWEDYYIECGSDDELAQSADVVAGGSHEPELQDLDLCQEGEGCPCDSISDEVNTRVIEKLWVKIVMPEMIRIRMRYYEENDAPDEAADATGESVPRTIAQEITYCGKFNIWWSKKGSAIRN